MTDHPAAVALGTWLLYAPEDAASTMHAMADLCRAAMLDPAVVYAANRVIANVTPRNYAGQIHAIDQFLRRRFRFVTNPIETQRIQSPGYLLSDIADRGFTQGACDDAAVLAAALGMANGIPARFRAIAFCHRLPVGGCDSTVPFSHVIADLWDRRAWIPLDVTKPGDLTRPPTIARELTFEV